MAFANSSPAERWSIMRSATPAPVGPAPSAVSSASKVEMCLAASIWRASVRSSGFVRRATFPMSRRYILMVSSVPSAAAGSGCGPGGRSLSIPDLYSSSPSPRSTKYPADSSSTDPYASAFRGRLCHSVSNCSRGEASSSRTSLSALSPVTCVSISSIPILCCIKKAAATPVGAQAWIEGDSRKEPGEVHELVRRNRPRRPEVHGPGDKARPHGGSRLGARRFPQS